MAPYPQFKERLRQERAALTLDMAKALFAKKGYHEIFMDEIVGHASVAKGTRYRHFPRKVDLACALFERNIVLFEQAVERISASPLGTRAKLEALLSFVHQQRARPHMQPIQLASLNGEISRGLQEKKETLSKRLLRTEVRIRVMFKEGKTVKACSIRPFRLS